jgi:cytoskeletal protein RodZ
MARRGRGWIAFAWAALATGVLVGVGVLVLNLVNGSIQFTDPGTSSSASASSSASPSASGSASGSSSGSASSGSSSSGSSSSGSVGSPTDQTSTQTLTVLNGTTTAGLAATGTSTLSAAGWNVASDGNAGSTGATATIVYYQKDSDAAVARGIAKTLGVGTIQKSSAFPNSEITVVLGSDYAK